MLAILQLKHYLQTSLLFALTSLEQVKKAIVQRYRSEHFNKLTS